LIVTFAIGGSCYLRGTVRIRIGRSRLIVAAALVAAATILAAVAPAGGSAGSGMVLAPPEAGRVYHAAFPDFGGPEDRVRTGRLRSFERAAGRRVTWAYFSDNWFKGRIHFPSQNVETIENAGRVPFIRMMARTNFGSGPDPSFSMQSIIDGAWDEPAPSNGIVPWCQGAAATGVPLLVEFGTEVNGEWFPWNGKWNGGGRTDGYGDPAVPDGPERFRDAYRHIVDVCRQEGADNITWFFALEADRGARVWGRRPAGASRAQGAVDPPRDPGCGVGALAANRRVVVLARAVAKRRRLDVRPPHRLFAPIAPDIPPRDRRSGVQLEAAVRTALKSGLSS
jgi:hypothetical protein